MDKTNTTAHQLLAARIANATTESELLAARRAMSRYLRGQDGDLYEGDEPLCRTSVAGLASIGLGITGNRY